MAARRRRKRVLPFRRYLPYAIATGVFVAVAALGYGLWRAWPAFAQRWKDARAEIAAGRDQAAKKKTPKPTGRTPASQGDLAKEIKALREENEQLREQLDRAREAIDQKNIEIDELKLRLLILEKQRAARAQK